MTARENLWEDTTFPTFPGETLQQAFDRIASGYDLRGFAATIELTEAGPHESLCCTTPVVGGNNVAIDCKGLRLSGSGRAGLSNGVNGLHLTVKNARLAAWGSPALLAIRGGLVNVAEGVTFEQGDSDHVQASYGGQVFFKNDYAVTGGAVSHLHAYSGGYITAADLSVNITPGLWFGSRWVGVADASVIARNMTYSNRATIHGQQYLVHKNGFLEIGGSTLPGNVAGLATTGGVVV